jgi:hypothetical protein
MYTDRIEQPPHPWVATDEGAGEATESGPTKEYPRSGSPHMRW